MNVLALLAWLIGDIADLEALVDLLSWVVAGLAAALVIAVFAIILLVILLKKP